MCQLLSKLRKNENKTEISFIRYIYQNSMIIFWS